jgi:CubicO group peptidase (beta-lactamase class C family)
MRRLLTILSAIVLLLVSLGIGVLTADLPFWRRASQLPLPADATYLPVAILGTGVSETPGVVPVSLEARSLDESMVEQGASRARALGSRALLVMHRGQIVVERYFIADDAGTLLPATVIARPIAAMSVGLALAAGHIRSLDVPVSTWLHEWDGDARGRITLRQLLEETSGLETGGKIRGLLRSSPLEDLSELPRFATARGVRMLLGNDYESSALGFRLDHEPGGFHNVSPANTQLVAVIVERATRQSYEHFVDTNLWRAARAGHAELQLDRRAGMPAAHCCWRATARDMLSIAALLAADGRHGDRQLLPAGWVREIAKPSRVSAGTGLQVNLLRLEGNDALEVSDEEGSAFWVIPALEITILNVGAHAGGELRELPALLLRGLAR